MYYIYSHVKRMDSIKAEVFLVRSTWVCGSPKFTSRSEKPQKKHMSYIIYSILNFNINDSKVGKRLNTNMG